MPRLPRSSRRYVLFFLLLSFAATGLLIFNSGGAGAQSTLSEPAVLPGDSVASAAAGAQESQQIAKGTDTYLSVWADNRTMLSASSGSSGQGTQKDIYAARLGADGQVIDTAPIVIHASGLDDTSPSVGWNGQNWLVVWHSVKQGQYSADYEIRAARVSPAGQLLDPTPIVLKADADSGQFTFNVIDDGAGNWVVLYEEYLPANGGSRGVLIVRVTNDGTLLDPGGRVIYSQWSLGNPRIARAGDRYLLTFVESGPPYVLKGVTLGASFNQLRTGPEVLSQSISINTGGYGLATDGNAWFVSWSNGGSVMKIHGSRVSREGNPVDIGGFVINNNAGTGSPSTRVCWDGQYWFVAYNTSYDHATQTYTNDDDISVSRVTGAGVVLDPTGIKVKTDPNDNQYAPGIAPGVNGGAQVTWSEQLAFDIRTARISREGLVSPEVNVAMGAPHQTEVRVAASGSGFLAVFRSETSISSRIMAQRLNANGAAVDAAAFVISDQPTSDNPSVAWDGSNYLVVWDQIKPPVVGENLPTPLQTFGRIVPPAPGASPAPEFFIMAGDAPDAAALNGTFLVVNAATTAYRLREIQFVRLSGTGTPITTPATIEDASIGGDAPGDSGANTPSTSSGGPYRYVPRVAAFGNRWLAVWQYQGTSSSSGAVHAAFVEQNGTVLPSFVVAGGNKPHLAVAGSTALIVWSSGNNINGELINADGSSPGTEMPLVTAPALQTSPAVAWDGSQYVLTWTDYRNEGAGYPKFTQGDIYAARVSATNVKLDEFPVADSLLPEETPFVIASNGLSLFAYAKFYNTSPYASYRITTRSARYAPPNTGNAPSAPTNLVATQTNDGPGGGGVRLTWADTSSNETGFKLEMRSTGGWTQIRLLPADTTFVDGLSAGSNDQYYFRVRAYNAAGDSAYSNEATPPLINITSPGGTFTHPTNYTITANASDPNGVALVEFFAQLDGSPNPPALLGADATAPYSFDWASVPPGYHHITAKATDTVGSSTVAWEVSIFVKQKPTAAITAPAEGSVYTQPASVTLTATAQTNNNRSDEYIERLDFYNGNVWIGKGTNTEWQAPFSFTWANAPAGTHTVTAHATSNWGDTGISAPVHITVNPAGGPGTNIKPLVTLTSPSDNTNVAGGAAFTASATATDADGTIQRVEFRANGFLVESDPTAPYTAQLSLSGGAHNVTAVAVDNQNGATVSAAARVNVARGAAGAQLTSSMWDGQTSLGPSVVTHVGPPVNQELADDFDITGILDRVIVYGSRGFSSAPNPTIHGVWVRFYAWNNGTPGAMQDEMFLPTGDPNLVFDRANPSSFDITLPRQFRASGKHFLSAQLLVEGYSGYWYWLSARTGQPSGAAVRSRDHYAGGQWGPIVDVLGTKNCDAAMAFFGTLTTPATINSVSPVTVDRSGWFSLKGTNLGASQGTSRLLVDKVAAIIVKWTDTEIVGYVPESTRLESVPVEIVSLAGTSNAVNIGVTARQSDGRIKWRAQVFRDYFTYRPAVAPAGSPVPGEVYASTGGSFGSGGGMIYAWSPNGALRWIVREDGAEMVSVGPDGTIYVGTNVRQPTGGPKPSIVALNRDGSEKWRVTDLQSTTSDLRAGPNVGPDGKIYAVFSPGLYNTAAFNPDGTLAWSKNDQLTIYSSSGAVSEIAFGRSLPRLYFFATATDGSKLFTYDLAGNRIFTNSNVRCCDTPAIPPDDNLRLRTSSYSSANGSLLYTFPAFGQGAGYPAAAGPDNTHYVIQNYYRLYAVNPNGSQKWLYDDKDTDGDFGWLSDPNVSPSNKLVLMGGKNAGKPGYFVAVNPADGKQLWRQILPDVPGFEPYGQIAVFTKTAFTHDGATAYTAGDVLAGSDGTDYCFFYALDTASDEVPINQPPKVLITSPLDGSNGPKVRTIEITAEAEDDQPIPAVEFYMQRGFSEPPLLLNIDTTAPYTASYTTSQYGGYAFIARVRDAGGLLDESRVTVLTSNESPRATWVSPAEGTTFAPGATITLKAKADDLDGAVTKVDFYSEGIIGEDTTPDADGNYTVQWVIPTVTGTYNVYARAHDQEGFDTSATNTIKVAGAPTPTPTPTPTPPPPVGQAPTVSITSPADNSVFAPGTSVNVVADAQDADGTIARVDFYHAPYGIHLGSDFNAPYTVILNSSGPDLKQIYARATDNSGNAVNSAIVRIIWEEPGGGNLSISGRIQHEQSQPGNEIFLKNALLELLLHNSLIRTTRTDQNGFYIFDRLSYGGEYTVRAVEPGFTFYPPASTWMGLIENETQNFVAEGELPPGPTPTPTPGANLLAWEKTYNSPYNNSDFDTRVAVDSEGNTYVTGESLAPGGNGDTDISTVKYSPAGEQLWAKTFVGRGFYKDWPVEIKVDAQGNAYVSGTSWRGSAYQYDIVTIKYDTAGNEQWVRYLNGPLGNSDFGNALELDAQGNAYVTGYDRTRDPRTGRNFDEYATVKYAPDGTELWIARRSEAQRNDHAIDVAVDANGNSYVTGFAYTGTDTNQSKDIVTVKYSPAGQQLWAARQDGRPETPGPMPLPNNPIPDEPGGVGVDPSGNVYVFGSNVPGSADDDFLLLRYNPATGALVWGRNWSGPAYDYARDMAIDASGNVYLTGESYDQIYQSVNGDPSSDAATVKFSPAGDVLWERIYRAFPGKWDGGRHVALDAAGNAYVGAYSEGFYNSDTVVIKYLPDGTESWVYRYDNPSHSSDSLEDMTVDAAGNVYATGDAMIVNANGVETMDFVTFKLAASTAGLNSPPDVTLELGPTIAGHPDDVTATGGQTAAQGPTILGPTIAGRGVTLKATAFDTDGFVVRVDFYDSATFIGSDTTSPYSFDWEHPTVGTHAVTAMAIDNSGATRTSQTMAVNIQPAPPPTYAIRGQVMVNGAPQSGVQVSLTGAHTANLTTDAEGRYSFTSLTAGGNFVVTPSQTNYTYTPQSMSYNDLAGDQTTNFSGTAIAPTPTPTPTPINTMTNVARGKQATQSSTYAHSLNPTAARAVDGNTGGAFMSGSVTATNSDYQAWWQVDLGSSYPVDSIRLSNRTDCCGARLSSFYVFVSDAPFNSADMSATQAQAGVSTFHTAGEAGATLALPVNRTGRYVRVQLSGTEILSLAEVEVLSNQTPVPVPVNLALNKSVTQSSTYAHSLNPMAARAVDGNTGGAFMSGSVTATNSDYQAWWQVDLGTSSPIDTIKLWNRTDCCGERLSNFYVFVSDVPFNSADLTATMNQAGVTSYHTAGEAGANLALTVNRTGRYVRVQLAGTSILSLAEIEVWGAPQLSSPVNHALNRQVTQSSTYAHFLNPTAARAVDGNTGGAFMSGSVTATYSDHQAWWQVDLGSIQSIDHIKLWNRTDCCGERLSNFYVFVSDTPFASTDLAATQAQAGVSAYHTAGEAGAQTSVGVRRMGRYVRVQLAGTSILSLAEIEVWGAP